MLARMVRAVSEHACLLLVDGLTEIAHARTPRIRTQSRHVCTARTHTKHISLAFHFRARSVSIALRGGGLFWGRVI